MADLETAYTQGPQTWNEAFPPICLRTHWDPTAVSSRILPPPQNNRNLALDPRPASAICKQYYTTSAGDASVPSYPVMENYEIPVALRGGTAAAAASAATAATAFPPGGAARFGFPYESYNPSAESELLRLREHLTKCAEKRYVPINGVPSPDVNTDIVSPFNTENDANIVKQPSTCRAEDDAAAWNRSTRLFLNPTRYDRTLAVVAAPAAAAPNAK